MGQYDFACNVGAELIGSDGWADTLRVHCYWKCNGWRYNMSPVYGWVTCNGQERLVANGIAINFQNNQGQYELGYSDYRLDRRQGDYTVSYSARLRSDSSYTSGARSSGSGSHKVGSLARHTVSYNANGGSGAPSAQTKWYGSTLTLSGTKPTRTGYTFQGWATSAGGGVAYQPGQGYGNDADITLYAVWKANTWAVKYNANGGSGAPADQTKTYGQTLKLSTTKPVRTDYNFMGWATSKANADAGTVTYAAGANYTANAAITLYAVWELAYVRPRITNLTISRCDSAGNISESGTYLRYDFNWATDLTGVYIQCQWKPQTAAWGSSSQKLTTILSNSSSKSGTITKKVVGSGAISTEQSWTARVYIYDSKGTSYATYSSDMSIGTIAYPIDVRKGGKGIAFGKVAETDNLADYNFDVQFRKNFKLKTPGGIKSFLDAVYPVGSIYMSVKSTNPGTLFGGTWVAIAQGRCLVGVNTSDNDFKTPEKTGGSKSHVHSTANHTLTVAEMPSHNHSLAMTDKNSDAGLIDRVHTKTYAVSGWWSWTSDTGGNQPHNHGNTGSASSLNPYLTCYIWKRTA